MKTLVYLQGAAEKVFNPIVSLKSAVSLGGGLKAFNQEELISSAERITDEYQSKSCTASEKHKVCEAGSCREVEVTRPGYETIKRILPSTSEYANYKTIIKNSKEQTLMVIRSSSSMKTEGGYNSTVQSCR